MARDVHRGTAWSAAVAQPAASARTASQRIAERRIKRSGERDVDGALVLLAVGVVEGDGQLARIGGLHGEGEERVLAHALRGVEGGDRLAEIGDGHGVDVLVLLVDDLPRLVALDA